MRALIRSVLCGVALCISVLVPVCQGGGGGGKGYSIVLKPGKALKEGKVPVYVIGLDSAQYSAWQVAKAEELFTENNINRWKGDSILVQGTVQQAQEVNVIDKTVQQAQEVIVVDSSAQWGKWKQIKPPCTYVCVWAQAPLAPSEEYTTEDDSRCCYVSLDPAMWPPRMRKNKTFEITVYPWGLSIKP